METSKQAEGGRVTLLESVTDGVLWLDQESKFTFINAPAERILGKSSAELLGCHSYDVSLGAISEDFGTRCREVLNNQTAAKYETWCDRTQCWLEVRIYPTGDGLIIFLHDITDHKQREVELEQSYDQLEHELIRHLLRLRHAKASLQAEAEERRRAEEALKATNAKLASVLESVTDGVCALDQEWRFTYINYRVAEMLHRSQNELAGKVIWDIYPHLQGTVFHQKSLEVAQTGKPIQFEENCQPLSRWIEFRIYPSPEGVSIYFHDVTARKQADLAIQQSLQKAEKAQEQFTFLSNLNHALGNLLNAEQALSTMLQSVVPFLADYCVIERIEDNSQLHPIAALHRDPEKQRLVEQLAHCYQRLIEDPNSYTKQALQRGESILISDWSTDLTATVTQDEFLLNLYHQLRPRSAMFVPLSLRGRCMGTMLLVMAESERRYTKDELALAEKVAYQAVLALDNTHLHTQVEELNRLKNEFLGSLSHELRTPLNAILGWSQLLNQRSFPKHIFHKGMETIERKSKELSQIIDDLLDMSCIIAGRLHLDIQEVDLSLLIYETVASLQLAIEAKSIDIQVDIQPSIHPVRGDRDRLRQVIWHLLSNAVKFTPNHEQITVTLKQDDRATHLEVADQGTGIRSSFLPHVFDPFRQANGSTTRSHGGLGVGLSLVRHLVELHGGNISVFSQGEDKGTSVKVTLPILDQNP